VRLLDLGDGAQTSLRQVRFVVRVLEPETQRHPPQLQVAGIGIGAPMPLPASRMKFRLTRFPTDKQGRITLLGRHFDSLST
jgi:hypothetical protein